MQIVVIFYLVYNYAISILCLQGIKCYIDWNSFLYREFSYRFIHGQGCNSKIGKYLLSMLYQNIVKIILITVYSCLIPFVSCDLFTDTIFDIFHHIISYSKMKPKILYKISSMYDMQLRILLR